MRNQVLSKPQTSPGPPQHGLPLPQGVQRSVPKPCPQLSALQSNSRTPPLGSFNGAHCQKASWLDPSPKAAGQQSQRGVCLSPSSAWALSLGGACGTGAPLNVTYCLGVDLGSAKLPSNSPAPQAKQKKGCSFGTFSPLSPFPISSGLAMV